MNPLAFLFTPFATSGPAADAPLNPCPDCKTPMRADESCDVCAMLRDYARERDGFGPARLSVRMRMGPPPAVVAELRAQLDAFTASMERPARAPSRARASRTDDDRAYEKKRARQRAGAKRAKEARKKQRGR